MPRSTLRLIRATRCRLKSPPSTSGCSATTKPSPRPQTHPERNRIQAPPRQRNRPPAIRLLPQPYSPRVERSPPPEPISRCLRRLKALSSNRQVDHQTRNSKSSLTRLRRGQRKSLFAPERFYC